MYYKEFMDMGCRERDDYLAQEIMKDNPSFLKRINAPHKRFNSREIIAEMNIEIMRLDTENKILSDTVKWMHDTIWEMIREQKGYTDQSAAQIVNSLQDDKSLPQYNYATQQETAPGSTFKMVSICLPVAAAI